MAFAGIKTLIQKRLDKSKWNLGPITPGGIRLLTDSQGNLIGLVTVPVNPQDTSPIAPGSSGNVGLLNSSGVRINPAQAVDPFAKLGGVMQLPYALTALTNPVFITLTGMITSTNNIMSLESPSGTDYSVPASKLLYLTKMVISAIHTTAVYFALGYADTGVADGTTDPTTPIHIIGINVASGMKSPYSVQVSTAAVDRPPIGEFDILAKIPAGKFPFFEAETDNTTKAMVCYGVEVDA